MWSYIKITLLLCFLSIVFAEEKHYEGNACIVKQTGEAGECKNFTNCTSAVQLAGHGVYPQMCSCEDESVCCGPATCPPLKPGTVNIQETGYKAWDYCISLADRVFPCKETENGWTRQDNCPPIPNENQTDAVLLPGEYPHMVRLGYGDINDYPGWYCIGSLISDEWVLTDSSCMNLASTLTFVVVGGWPAGGPILSDANAYPILRTILHPDYNNPSAYSTLGLVQLTKRVVLSKFVLPACLHTGTSLSDKDLIMIDWNWSGLVPTGFQKYPLDRVSHEECSNTFPDGLKESAHICTKVKSEGEWTTWRQRGSTLQQYGSDRVACTYLLSGVYSFSSTTVSHKTHVFTRVAPHVAWIESVVWPRVQTRL